jgi:ribosomal-protein-alanine N-acetyltransferase
MKDTGPATEIHAGRYLIRSWKSQDAPALAKYLGNPNVTRTLVARHPWPYMEEHARAWVELCALEAEPVNFAIVSDGEAIGGIGLSLLRGVRRQSAEVGFWVGEPYWGHGTATTVVRAFADFAFAKFDLVRLFAYVFDRNVASMRVLEKAGFVYEGRLAKSVVRNGETIDELVYARVVS